MTNQKKAKTLSQSDQSRRFIEAARELGCDEDPRVFERVFEQIVPPKRRLGDVPAEDASRKQRRRSPKVKRQE